MFTAKEVDPDDNLLPPSQRCSYECDKDPTGPLDRKKLIEHINKQALETPDKPELKPYVPGVIRGKKVDRYVMEVVIINEVRRL